MGGKSKEIAILAISVNAAPNGLSVGRGSYNDTPVLQSWRIRLL
jgi:hypothetical protein